jgi:hypothetical protein
MKWAEKTRQGIEDWFTKPAAPDKPSWSERIFGWMTGWASKGLKKGLEDIEPGAIAGVKDMLLKLRDNPNLTPEMKALIDKTLTPGNPIVVVLGVLVALAMLTGTLGALFAPVNRLAEQQVDQLVRSFRFDPGSVMAAWRRDKEKNKELLGDLRDMGWSPDRIETLKEITEIIPGVQDLVRFGVREAFDDAFAAKWGTDDEFSKMPTTWAEKLGLSPDWSKRFWRAHWELPAVNMGYELLHRGLITEAELTDLMVALDIMPGWRAKLIKLSWNIPTRVDVRRFWDLRTIDEKRLREVYTGMGYHAQDLEDYILWTKIYVEFPDLLARFKNGWISLDDVRQRLTTLGMKPAAVEELIQTKVQAEGAARSNAERDLTLTDIYKGVKMERITRAEAVGLIMDLGYSTDEAGFKLDVNVPTDETTSAVEQRQLAKSDVLNGLKNNIITREGARQMLLQLRYAAVDVEFLLKLYDAQIKPPTEVKLLEASKADIVLGVKKGLITQSEGHAMLLDLGYAPAAADFILTVQTTESPFSPVNFDEFKDRTQKWRLAAGMEGKPMTEEIKRLGADVVRLQAEVDALYKSVQAEQGKLVPDTVIPAEAGTRVKELQALLYKAQAELARVRTDYNAKVAEWKHAAK